MEDSLDKNELIDDIIEYFDRIVLNIPERLSVIREGNGDEIVTLLEGISYCFRGLLLTKDIHNIEINDEFLTQKTREILEAFENQDYHLIGDIVEYEILDFIIYLNTELKNYK